MKSLSPELSEILKNIFIRVADIAKASGSDTEKTQRYRKRLWENLSRIFQAGKELLPSRYAARSGQKIYAKLKVSIIEIARLLAGGLDQIYNDIISRTSIDNFSRYRSF